MSLDGETQDEDYAEGEDTPKGRYSLRRRKNENVYDTSFLGRSVLSDDDFESECNLTDQSQRRLTNSFNKATLFDIEYELPGTDVFTFKTPKRKDQMGRKAFESATKNNLNDDPPQIDKTIISKKGHSKSKKNDSINKTPHSIRCQTRRQLAKRSEIVISSDEMDTSSDSTDEASLDESNETREKNAHDVKPSNLIEKYFLAHGNAKIHTSDNTLSSLDQPKINQEVLQEKMKSLPKKHQKETSLLLNGCQALFDKWLHVLSNGFNVLLFGLGSKFEIIDQFRLRHLSNSDCVVINGYFPNLSIRQILNTICNEVMDCDGKFSSMFEQLEFLKETYSKTDEHSLNHQLYIVIHNIDAATLRRSEDQHVLSLLAALSNVHVLASVDHINCSLLWDQTKLHLMSWLWFDVTNFTLYSKETSYENSLLVQHSGQLALSSLSHVFKSLTPNAQGIFMLLANYQLEEKESSSNYMGLSFQEYYQKCREEFLVNSDLTLRAQLTEFKDHKLIKIKKASDGVEHLSIPLNNSTLLEFVKQQQS